jgi:CheY-like chemotaxis protein
MNKVSEIKDEKRTKKILIVESDRQYAYFLARELGQYGNTYISNDGHDALQKVLSDHFDVIICDSELPVIDGVDFYKAAVERDPKIKDRLMLYSNYFSSQKYQSALMQILNEEML